MERLGSYSDVFSVGHKALSELFDGDVVVEEKVDGSQISFAKSGDTLLMRSKGKQIVLNAPDKMFSRGVETVVALKDRLIDGWVYRGEYLMSPKHNALGYSRIPASHIILYDVDKGQQDYLSYEAKKAVAEELGLEVVPLVFRGRIESVEQLKSMLPADSVLGGVQPEGIVIKNYSKFAPDKKVLMGKYVREEFAEINAVEWKKANPTGQDILQALIAEHRTEARFMKAVQHLRDAGKLEGTPRDIGILLHEVEADIQKECAEAIKERLWTWAWPKVARGAKAGLPEWYKNKLLEAALPSNGG